MAAPLVLQAPAAPQPGRCTRARSGPPFRSGKRMGNFTLNLPGLGKLRPIENIRLFPIPAVYQTVGTAASMSLAFAWRSASSAYCSTSAGDLLLASRIASRRSENSTRIRGHQSSDIPSAYQLKLCDQLLACPLRLGAASCPLSVRAGCPDLLPSVMSEVGTISDG
jgi:hypothetical protein